MYCSNHLIITITTFAIPITLITSLSPASLAIASYKTLLDANFGADDERQPPIPSAPTIYLQVAEFWSTIASLRYFVDPLLHTPVTNLLRRFLKSGIRGQSARFLPSPAKDPAAGAMLLYLWGGAGIGKSAFAKVRVPAL